MAIESFAVLIVEPGRAKLSRFNLELRGETLWATNTEELSRRLDRARPELVAVAGEAEVAAELAEELRRRGLAQSVFLITPAAEGDVGAPGQVPVILPQGAAALDPEGLLRRLMQAVLSAQARTPVSPLTGLPGSPTLRQEVERRLAAGETFIFLYLDLDNFKAYNDVYGFGRGDIAIRLLSREVVDATESHGEPTDVCVHIGGDDFAVVTTTKHQTELAQRIISGFEDRVPDLYSEEARAQGYIETRSRRGEFTRYPLMTVSIGGVDTAQRRVTGYLHLTEVAAEVKSYAKALEGSQFVMDRRRE
jgi:diguanylate cyclase (GGDEF)-like protein